MQKVEPKIFLIGETKIDNAALQDYLCRVGAPEWKTDAPSDSEKVIEVMGRMCYRSFAPGLNLNVTKVREGNAAYLHHILEVGHGSVLEHATFNFIFADVSRIFTHELVRHRAGTAISQESLRFVRLDNLGFWLPTVVREDQEVVEIFVRTVEELESLQKLLAKKYDLDGKMPFSKKKQITSAMRRIAPDGLATSIGWSVNGRALRHVIEMRTDPGAEEEIRLVFSKVAEMMIKKCPNLMSGYDIEMVDGLPWYKTNYKKV